MPELAFMFSVGFFVALLSLGLLIWLEFRTERSAATTILQENLGLIGARWSHGQDAAITAMSAEGKSSSHIRSLVFVMIGCAFLSWLGVFFSILIWISFRPVMHKRRAGILATKLSQVKMKSAENVLMELKAFNDLYPT